MDELLLIKDWRTVYLQLSEPVPALQQPIMDTITFDSLEAYRPLCWMHNAEDGSVVAKNVHNAIFADLLENLLKLSTRRLTTYAYLSKPEVVEPLVMVSVGPKRVVLTSRTLPGLQTLYPKGVDGITLMKYIGRHFDPRVFIYEREDTDEGVEDSVRIRPRDALEKDENTLYPEATIVSQVHSCSLRIVAKLSSSQKLHKVVMLFRFELTKEEPWLLSVEESVFRKAAKKPPAAPHFPSVISLHISDELGARRPLPRRENSLGAIPRDSRPLAVPPCVCKSSSVNLNLSRCETEAKQALFRPMRPTTLSKSFVVKPKSNRRQKVVEPCPGKYCSVFSFQHRESAKNERFPIPLKSLRLANNLNFSPVFHSHFRKLPSPWQAISPLAIPSSVPTALVCAHCYYIYSKVATSLDCHRKSLF